MSHVVSVKTIIKDLDCLRAAVAMFPKLIWKENQKKYEWWGRWVKDYHKADAAYKNGIDPSEYGKCEHAIGMPGVTYEMGICKRSDGQGYSPVWDFVYDGHRFNEYLGDSAEQLMTEYNRQVMLKYGEQNGYAVNEEVLQDGRKVITLNQY